MTDVAVAVLAFVLMEPFSYLAHRFVMHGPGMGLHRSHHRIRVSRFEANDAFPVIFAAVTVMVMAAGATLPDLRLLLVAGGGVTAYGLAYMFVHDVYIHRRLPFLRVDWAALAPLREAHRIHHLFGEEPYGMLVPVVPARLRVRAATNERDPFAGAAVQSAAAERVPVPKA